MSENHYGHGINRIATAVTVQQVGLSLWRHASIEVQRTTV